MGNTNTNQQKMNPDTIETQASNATAQVNALISQSNDAFMCGPACQQQKSLLDLEQKYVSSQTNLKTAPEQLKIAKKNYYLALDGQSGYNKMILDKVTLDATNVVKLLQEKFNENVKLTEDQLNVYDSLTTNHNYMNDLLVNYLQENENMAKSLKKIRGDIITNDRKTYYEQQYIDGLEKWYWWYRVIYIIFIIIFIGLVFFKNKNSWMIKILMILFFIFYPIFITPFIIYIINCIYYIIDFFPKNTFTSLNNY